MSTQSEDARVSAARAKTDAALNPSTGERVLRWARVVLPVLLISLVGVLLYRELAGLHPRRIRATTASIPDLMLLALAAVGMLSVLSMSLYDWLLCRWLKIRLTATRLLRYSFVANSFNNSVGMSGMTGSGIRYLVLSREGVDARTAATYAGLQVLSGPVGLSVLALAALVLHPELIVNLPIPAVFTWGALAVIGLYLPAYLFLTGRGPVHTRFLASMPPLTLSHRLALIGVSTLEWALAGATLWACLYTVGVELDPTLLLCAFALAASFGVLSMIPGGLGVLDATLLVILTARVGLNEELLAGVLLFRVMYFLVPLLAGIQQGAGLLTLDDEHLLARLGRRVRLHPLMGVLRLPTGMLSQLGVRALAYMTFTSGMVLLFSAAFPTMAQRAVILRHYVPLSAVEGSHLLSVAAGVLLIGLSRGIAARVRTAYDLTQAVLLGGALFSLLKGIAYEQAIFLLLVASLLRARRESFFRQGYALFSLRSALWLGAVVLGLAAYVAVGALVHMHSPDVARLFHFTYRANYQRYTDSLPVIVLTLLAFTGWQWFRMPGLGLQLPAENELEAARAFYQEHGSRPFSHLTFMGDKYLMHAAGGRVLIPFGIIRNRLVALGDPAGDEEVLEQGIREFREFANRYDRVAVFYQVDESGLHRYHDAGFALLKLGEKALVPVTDFTLKGRRNQDLRTALNKGERIGLALDVLEPPFSDADWAELEAVSTAWMADKQGAEKQYSIGPFRRDYLSWSPIATVRQEGRIIAFASLMPSYGHKRELGIDLMRQRPDAPNGTMDYLFVQLMQLAHSQGYEWFNLGMAPLSGVGQDPWARGDERLIRMIYEYGNVFYNYQGLRRYKEKFNPVWRSLYLAYPHERQVRTLLLDLAALVAGGYRRALLKS